MSRLLDLSEDILTRILEFLLSAPEVKTFKGKPFYDLQVAVLRTNKVLHVLGREVLAANHLIMLSCPYPAIFHQLNSVSAFGPFLWEPNVDCAIDVRMKISLEPFVPDTPAWKGIPDHKASADLKGLICIHSLPDLILTLLEMDLKWHPHLQFVFEVYPDGNGQALTLKRQRALLEPFQSLHCTAQTCSIRGCVDSVLAKETARRMMPEVHWFRATRWRMPEMQTCLQHQPLNLGKSSHLLSTRRDTFSEPRGTKIPCSRTGYLKSRDTRNQKTGLKFFLFSIELKLVRMS